MASFSLPDGSQVAVATALGPAIIVSDISNASEAVADVAAASGLAASDIVVVNSNWLKLDGRCARLKEFDDDAATLENIDTSNETLFLPGEGAGSLQKVTGWTPLSQITGFESSGGDQNFATIEFLDDDQQRQAPTSKSAQSIKITVADNPAAAFNNVLEAADLVKAIRPVRLSLPNGAKIYYNGYVSFNSTPTLSKNNVMSVTMTLALVGRPVRYQS